MHTYLRRMCYPMSRSDAGKTHSRKANQLLIDKQILKHCKKHQCHLAMGWIDYKKAYDMVPYRWMIEDMKMVRTANNINNIVNLFENTKDTWRIELLAYNESLGEVDIRRVIFQGDSFSSYVFCCCSYTFTDNLG